MYCESMKLETNLEELSALITSDTSRIGKAPVVDALLSDFFH